MLVILSLLGLCFASLGLLVRELWSAPEGYEDQTGFHVVDGPQRVSRTRTSKPHAPAVYEERAVINA